MDKEQFIEKFAKLQDESKLDDYGFNLGKYEGEDFLIVDTWESIIQLQALINGYTGNVKNIPYLFNSEDLNTELNKAEQELEKTLKDNPNHLGTIYRLESRIEGLINLSAYKRWLLNNELDEVDIDSVIDMGFSDEHDMCCDCYQNVVRTSPDSYCWTAPLFIDCEGYVCDDCAKNHTDYILEEYCNVQKNIPDQFSTDELGLVKINKDSYQNGLHYGMDDTPKPIIKNLNKEGIDVWFKVYPSQFYCEFDVYVKEADKDQAEYILNNTDTYQGYSGAGNCEKALREASIQSSKVEGEGIKYTKIDVSTGTAETRLVSNEEFIKGIKD
jgi:hypothetical protein